MDMERSTRHRSLGVNSQVSPTAVKTQRSDLVDKRKSAPLASRKHQTRVPSRTSSHRVESPNSGSNSPAKPVWSEHPCPAISLVVLGKSRVGKTTFVRSALALDKWTTSDISSNTILVAGGHYYVQLCEINLDDLEITDGQILNWPEPVGNHLFPKIEGVLCLYDVTNEESIVDLPQTVYILSKNKIPVTLVACKSDAPMSEQEVGIAFVERMRRAFPLAAFSECSSASIDSATICLITAVNTSSAIKRIEATTNTKVNEDEDDDVAEHQKFYARLSDLQLAYSTTSAQPMPKTNTTLIIEELRSSAKISELMMPSMPAGSHGDETLQSTTMGTHGNESTTDDPLQPEDDSHNDLFEQQSSASEKSTMQEDPRIGAQEGGVPFSDLITRLLKMPVTKNDAKFVPTFLCLYRAFATPKRLLMDITDRFARTDRSDLVPLVKVGELLRYLQVLTHWTAHYPGDFVEPTTRRMAMSFAHDLELSRNFAPAAKEIISNLLTIIMDDDHDWAYEERGETGENVYQKSITSWFSLGKVDSNHIESDTSDEDRDAHGRSIRNSGTGSTNSSIVRSSITSSQSATNLFNLENAREQSRLFKSVPHIPLTKLHWHHFMSVPTEELAREITRIDWTMYSAIRARDFVRHVSLSSQKRAKLKHSDTIGMMVKHFNHLALFVSGMILFRDKPKHRAKMLEKFMDLAWKVRQLNNYNSLGAIVAGITGPEVTRLRQTHELIPNETQKQFLRLTVLMSISRSHAAYRMAWDNSFSERIPFVPLIRQDLTMAASANPTFIGVNINWKKFEIMGDVIIGVQRSHEHPYSFLDKTPKNPEITRLILETKVIEESEDSADPRSELYDRSLQLEPQTGGDARKSMTVLGVKKSMTGWF